ncbi:TetR/AcrR family transcriptional regulator [Actinophytocola algeriensis]|uniref:AcrR family transcriptional regulator n=1 Tax=Actinophytocola algeriensis TaxID=1768010 RepID=A0A7W7VDF8_9PSEU|nr:TetR/AcrR family transcriptional regulator [Actinophytocola algeriensis]MBB4905940.1 AcrR family transcriptional regulator [Actinophytocola algeriensis]MBE1472375.1 AcrR family transcriptional regulator [Actinophytocola algeriensis]
MAVLADGRALRAERTRESIIDAHMALMLDGDLQPTARRIAERAGVSLRTLWGHFKDLETLFAAAGHKALEIQYTGFRPVPADQPLADRIEQFCLQRARMLDVIAGASRAAQVRLPFSAQLRRNRARHNERLRAEAGELFRAELAGDDELLTAVLVATTWPAWMGCRDDLGLSVAEATAVMRRAVTALLATREGH